MSSYHHHQRKRFRDQDVYDDIPLQQPALEQAYRIDMHPDMASDSYQFSDINPNFHDTSHFSGSSYFESAVEPQLTPLSQSRLDPPRLVEDRFSPPKTEDHRKKFGTVMVYPPKVKKPPIIRGPKTASILRVGSLPRSTTKKHLNDLFSQYGRIKQINHKPTSHFARIEFEPGNQDDLMRAVTDLDRSFIKFGKVESIKNCGSIQVQFSHESNVGKPKSARSSISSSRVISYGEAAAKKSLRKLLKQAAEFTRAALSLKSWFDQGHCTRTSANMFFSHLSYVNINTRKAIDSIKVSEQQLECTLSNHRQKLASMKKESQIVVDIFHSACQESWSHFSNSQQKLITKWSENGNELLEKINTSIDNISLLNSEQVPVKRVKVESDSSEEIKALQKEIDELRKENEVAIQAKDQEIQSLKDILARFREKCSSTWEEIPEGQDIQQEEEKFDDFSLKMVDEVSLHESMPENDTNVEYQDTEEDKTATSIASVQRPLITDSTTEWRRYGILSEAEISTIAVMAAFLAVHPLGASIEEITTYLRGFDHMYTPSYLESLLQRLNRVFQFCRVGGGNMPQKWCFLGFQTCCAEVD